MRRSIFGLVGLVVFTPFVAADELDDALAAYEAKRYDQAIMLLTPLAEAGTVDAQVVLSNIHNFGFGVPVDQATAVLWLSMAAEQGDPDALYNLGVMTLQGQGTEPDAKQGLRLLRRAAELDSADALFALGVMAVQNAPQTGDIDTGLGYLTRAGQLGERKASATLAFLLEDLPEVEHHRIKSAMHYQIAIARGCDDLDEDAARVVASLSPDERASYEYNLPASLEISVEDASVRYEDKGHCLSQ